MKITTFGLGAETLFSTESVKGPFDQSTVTPGTLGTEFFRGEFSAVNGVSSDTTPIFVNTFKPQAPSANAETSAETLPSTRPYIWKRST
jgi:hypothetical protein